MHPIKRGPLFAALLALGLALPAAAQQPVAVPPAVPPALQPPASSAAPPPADAMPGPTERLTATDLHWISGEAPHCDWVYAAKTRYRQKDAPCTLTRVDAEHCTIEFAEPQWAVTPGQSVVVYESQVCLGGGIIERGEPMSATGKSTEQTACPPDTIESR